tara:strand:+ start:4646 stop:5419 length:774 start_codon:yes stop_codon:yes gene_type:complete
MKKKINWNTIDLQIKKLKLPLSFIYNILKNQNNIEDYHLSLIIRFFFKNQTKISMEFPLFIMFNILDENFKITKQVVNEYYSCILKKYLFIEIISKFKKSFDKKEFWNKDIYTQKCKLEQLHLIFKSHFDSSITGLSGVTKLVSQIKCKNNSIILLHLKWRLSDSINLLGKQLIEDNGIKLISEENFDNLDNNDKIKYVLYYYLKVDKLFKLLINTYELLLIYDNKLKQIINPKPVYINFTTIYSDNDSEDFSLLLN